MKNIIYSQRMAYLTRDFNQITFVYSDQAACIITQETVSVYRKKMFIMNKKSFTIVECIMRFVKSEQIT
jgi:hypothetical protein